MTEKRRYENQKSAFHFSTSDTAYALSPCSTPIYHSLLMRKVKGINYHFIYTIYIL